MWWRTNKHSRNPWVVTWRPRRRRSIRRNRDACAAMAAMGAPRCGDKPTACAESPLQLSAIPQRCACGYACGRVHVRIVADFSGFRWRPFRLWRFVKLRGRVLVGSIFLEKNHSSPSKLICKLKMHPWSRTLLPVMMVIFLLSQTGNRHTIISKSIKFTNHRLQNE